MVTSSVSPTSISESVLEKDSPGVVGLVRQLLDELALLFRQEVRLASAEVSLALKALLTGAAAVAAAAAVLFAGLLVLLAAAVIALAGVVSAWLAALIVGILTLIVGLALVGVGRARFRATTVKPLHSVESLKRDKDVLTRSAR